MIRPGAKYIRRYQSLSWSGHHSDICRIDISEDETFSGALQKMNERDLASLQHQHVSFREVRKWLDIPAGRLVNTMVNYRKWPKVEREMEKCAVVFENTRGYDPWDVSCNPAVITLCFETDFKYTG